MTKIYRMPKLKGTGSRPVWSVYIAPVASLAMREAKQTSVLLPFGSGSGNVDSVLAASSSVSGVGFAACSFVFGVGFGLSCRLVLFVPCLN